ncbi:MAG: DNA-3-methyladenine glycosylase [Saprospiraceae bacterium]|nr:DNA-3-methyladenine glycosylase [Saprospiraceae bacterium]
MILPESYYQNEDVVWMAQDLLGKILLTNIEGKHCSGIIAETEAYRAPDDRACHAYANRLTPRTKTMFETGGTAYVYLCYGMYHLINVVTGPASIAHAVLIRSLIPLDGKEHMQMRRNLARSESQWTKGPGALSIAMGVNLNHNGLHFFDSQSAVQIHNKPISGPELQISISKRVGVINSGECANRMWRFFIKDSPYVSHWRP